MDDVFSVILGFCDGGSDYKSWVLVCKLWRGVLCGTFPTPKVTFGNKIINIIDDAGILDSINSDRVLVEQVNNNPYVPQHWKIENLTTDRNINWDLPPLYPFFGTVSTAELESANQDLSLLSHFQIIDLINNINPKLYRLLAFNILIKQDWKK